MSWNTRLRAAFEATGWSKAELGRRANVPYDNVNKYLEGKVKQPRGEQLDRLAEALGMDPVYLERGVDPVTGGTDVPIMGYLGAGAEVEPDYEQVPPDGFSQVTLPFPLPGDMIAFQVRGVSMLPVFKDGAIIVVWREQRRPIESFFGEEAAVRTAEGKRFIKTIMRGSLPNTVNLMSWNDPQPIENQRVEWIGEIFTIMPPKALRQAQRAGGIQGQLGFRSA